MTKDIEPIYNKILSSIVTLKMKPGERLRENEVSTKYKVSRTPIRDVFKKLENDNLLEIRSKSGTFVTKIDLKGITDIMFLRSSVEFQVLDAIKGTLTAEEIQALRANLAQQAKLRETKKDSTDDAFANSLFDLDNSFHEAIYAKDKKESVLQLLNSTYPAYQRFRFLTFFRDDNDLDALLALHTKMLDVLEKPDNDGLRNIVYQHNFSGLNGINKVKDRHPEYFE
ncbi:MAG: GntR family transcriptional regulator [Bacilli bacterium]|jgi:DNA-binding GntR family transcriptional regulator|nr:GntR family transcriptional regulator [Bacilli bacterium]